MKRQIGLAFDSSTYWMKYPQVVDEKVVSENPGSRDPVTALRMIRGVR